MMLTSRQKSIIQHLQNAPDYTTVKELSNYFNLSERSIQYDLENIEYFAHKKGVDISRDKKFGIKINEINKLNQMLPHNQQNYVVHSPKSRVEKILLQLFLDTKPISSNKFAKLLFVTRRTVVDDLKSVKEWLTDFFLQLSYIQNKGFCIQGDEQNIRDAYAALIKEHNNMNDIFKYVNIDSIEIEGIIEVIQATLEEEDYKIIQKAEEYLIIYVLITFYRVMKRSNLNYEDKVMQKLKQEKEFHIANRIMGKIQSTLSIVFTEADVGYITLHLLGAKQDSDMKLEKSEKEFFNSTLDTFIRRVSGFMGVDLTSDKMLINGLTVHLKPAINRLRFQLKYNNPLKDEVLHRYPDIVETVKSSIHVLEEENNVQFNLDEITYLTLHIQSAVERNFQKTRYALKVIIVCASGVGTSQLLKAKIENYYPELKVHDTFSVYDIEEDYFGKHGINFVISTIPATNFPISVIQVTPFLNRNDRKKLNEIVNNEREKVIESVLTPGPNLNELLTPELMLWEVNVADREEAIEVSTELLLKNGFITSNYKDAIKRRVEIHGSYMVIEKGVAMPHARPTDGVLKTGFSLVKLKTPITFGNERYDPVSIILCLAAFDAHVHLNALRQLSLILQDNDKKSLLINGTYIQMKYLINEVSNK